LRVDAFNDQGFGLSAGLREAFEDPSVFAAVTQSNSAGNELDHECIVDVLALGLDAFSESVGEVAVAVNEHLNDIFALQMHHLGPLCHCLTEGSLSRLGQTEHDRSRSESQVLRHRFDVHCVLARLKHKLRTFTFRLQEVHSLAV